MCPRSTECQQFYLWLLPVGVKKPFNLFVWIYWHYCIDFRMSVCLLFWVLFIVFALQCGRNSRKITNFKIISIYCLSSRYCEEYKEDMRKKNEREPEKEIRRDKRERCPGQARELRKRTTEGALDAETPWQLWVGLQFTKWKLSSVYFEMEYWQI